MSAPPTPILFSSPFAIIVSLCHGRRYVVPFVHDSCCAHRIHIECTIRLPCLSLLKPCALFSFVLLCSPLFVLSAPLARGSNGIEVMGSPELRQQRWLTQGNATVCKDPNNGAVVIPPPGHTLE